MSQSPSQGSGSLLLAEEYFGAEDPRFLQAIRAVRAPKALAGFVDRWKRDVRPFARAQILAYLAEPLDSVGHNVVVKRWFKHAEAQGDDEIMAAMLVALDVLVRRVRKTRQRYDWQAREIWTEERLVTPRDVLPRELTVKRREAANGRERGVHRPGPHSPQRPALHASHAGLPPPPRLALLPQARLPAPRALRAGDCPGVDAIPRRRSRPGREHPRHLGPGACLLSRARGLGVYVVADPAQRRPLDRRFDARAVVRRLVAKPGGRQDAVFADPPGPLAAGAAVGDGTPAAGTCGAAGRGSRRRPLRAAGTCRRRSAAVRRRLAGGLARHEPAAGRHVVQAPGNTERAGPGGYLPGDAASTWPAERLSLDDCIRLACSAPVPVARLGLRFLKARSIASAEDRLHAGRRGRCALCGDGRRVGRMGLAIDRHGRDLRPGKRAAVLR